MDKDGVAFKPHSLWRNREYMLLWVGFEVSGLGTAISQLAFPLLILILTSSPTAAGLAAALERLPSLLLSLPAGALVDRWNRKHVMIVCTFGLALCIASIPVALIIGQLTIVQLYLVAFVVGTLSLFFDLAVLAAITQLVPKPQLPAAVAQSEAAYSTISLLAPSLSGFLFALGRLFPFVADTISYLVLLGVLFRIRTPLQEKRVPDSSHLFAEVREGIRWLWSQPVIGTLAFLTGYFYVLMNGSVLIVLVIARQQHISPALIGLIFAMGGIGNIVGTLLVGPVQRRTRFGWALLSMLLLFVVFWPLYGIASTPFILGGVVAVLAIIDSIASVLMTSYRLSTVPDDLQGRVGSAYHLVISGSLTVGLALIGIGLQQFGVLATLAVLWGGLVVLALLALLNSGMRRASFSSNP